MWKFTNEVKSKILTAELYSHVFRSPNLSAATERLCDGVRNWTGLYSMTNLMQELEIDWLVNTLHMKKASQIDVRWSRNVAIWDSCSGIYQETSCRLQRRCHKNQTKPKLGFSSKLLIFNKKPVCLLSLNLFFYKITCFSLFSNGFCKGVGLMSWLSWKLLVSTLLVRKSLDSLQNC